MPARGSVDPDFAIWVVAALVMSIGLSFVVASFALLRFRTRLRTVLAVLVLAGSVGLAGAGWMVLIELPDLGFVPRDYHYGRLLAASVGLGCWVLGLLFVGGAGASRREHVS